VTAGFSVENCRRWHFLGGAPSPKSARPLSPASFGSADLGRDGYEAVCIDGKPSVGWSA